eukprot:GEMP01002467.1.p1 GENE.GEMP01002467.1~~GEMP01002467.1.p1  ORF type:complete len:732 (+),score=138.76 GEMP01002467.1:1765-3960(+)
MDTRSSLFSAEGRSELLDVISQVKSSLSDTLGVVDFPIPQFILVGKQSVGKSRLIESLAGETFNFVSGTLGSRRPTILEFRNVKDYLVSKWLILNPQTNQFESKPTSEVMAYLGNAHESLGASVSDVAVYVRIESAHSIDMQIVDLPGFRDFAADASKAELSAQIDEMVQRFMADPRNVMLCVEEAGDAANLATLSKCRKYDPKFERTILIRNKLDKYYRDLSSDNVSAWLDGFGDLPTKLPKFALTLPNWKDGTNPDRPFVELRSIADAEDVEKIRALGGRTETIGYSNFSIAVGNKLERMFASAIVPVLKKVQDMKEGGATQLVELEDMLSTCNPLFLENSIREAGMSFGRSLQHVMEGFIRSDSFRYTLKQELEEFHNYHQMLGSDFPLLPSEDFSCLEDYVWSLSNEMYLPAVGVEINGGAQFRRLMGEVEIFCRFAEVSLETKEIDVIQAKGVSVHDVTWSDVVRKLLSNEAHGPMIKRITYVAERIEFFFKSQKPVMLDFMSSIKGTSDEGMYSALFPKYASVMKSNEFMRHLVYQSFDKAVERQKTHFLNLFCNTLTSVFANPWVFLKKASAIVQGNELEDLTMPTFEGAKKRVPEEINARLGIENILQRWLANIPAEMTKIETSVDMAQMLLLKTFHFIRCTIADQIDLYAESFFKLPMLRRLEEDMRSIELSESERGVHRDKHEELTKDYHALKTRVAVLAECDKTLKGYTTKIRQMMREKK